MQLLHTREEVLKPEVSSGTLWVLSALLAESYPSETTKKSSIMDRRRLPSQIYPVIAKPVLTPPVAIRPPR